MSNEYGYQRQRPATAIQTGKPRQTDDRTGPEAPQPICDVSGFAVFSAGELGAAHATAHRLLDAGRIARGRKELGQWLEGRTGSGSEWLHLQFHMGIFELETGDWEAAYKRFLDEILPAAATTSDALTDAPALLWRLALTAPTPLPLPWQPLQRTAARTLGTACDPYVEIHNMLALAGARDVDGLERWSQTRAFREISRRDRIVDQMRRALKAYASGAFASAARRLQQVLPRLSLVGGSHAQNQLFEQIEDHCWRLAHGTGLAQHYSAVA